MTRFPDAAAFPPGFLFGAANSAYQIEGAVAADGRGPCWWDGFAHTRGRIADGSNADVACDHYHRWPEDLDWMQRLNLGAYRFSIAWPRVLPEGRARLNPAGLDFYERLVDGLLARGIVPCATLYHWDLPQPLADAGGWQVRETAAAFAEYAAAVVRRLGDRVARWATLNEPRCAAWVGHLEGRHAPGLQDLRATLAAAHHLLLAHGQAMQAMRAECAPASLGIVLDVKPYTAAVYGSAHAEAVRRADGVFNRWFLDPLFHAQYPADIVDELAAEMPPVRSGDLALIAQPLDHLGLNYYTRGHVRDPARTRYLAGHLAACAQALAEGVPLDAYLVGSLMDNFEWGRGLTQRFGLLHVDFRTLQRRPKDSALAYRDFIAAHAAARPLTGSR